MPVREMPIAITVEGFAYVEGATSIDGAGIKVLHIVQKKREKGLSPEELSIEFPFLSLTQIYMALAYYHAHQAEIDAQIAEGRTEEEESTPVFEDEVYEAWYAEPWATRRMTPEQARETLEYQAGLRGGDPRWDSGWAYCIRITTDPGEDNFREIMLAIRALAPEIAACRDRSIMYCLWEIMSYPALMLLTSQYWSEEDKEAVRRYVHEIAWAVGGLLGQGNASFTLLQTQAKRDVLTAELDSEDLPPNVDTEFLFSPENIHADDIDRGSQEQAEDDAK